jgi:hypothetical protein
VIERPPATTIEIVARSLLAVPPAVAVCWHTVSLQKRQEAMKSFHCDHCGRVVFFENVRCINCSHTLGFLPDAGTMSALVPAEAGLYAALSAAASGRRYRLCANSTFAEVCNWLVPADDPQIYCRACRLNRTIPNLSEPGNRERWQRLEAAKRRLVYTLLALELPVVDRSIDAERGLAFEFLADAPSPGAHEDGRVMTGHDDGLITLNIAEADDIVREQTRQKMGESYRTLLGHFRHEVGHYYWDRLIEDGGLLEEFRGLFGDEQVDYDAALERHYENGPPAHWPERFISAYASSHPWEDWAETWAHYLHIVDTLETAASFHLTLTPESGELEGIEPPSGQRTAFDDMLAKWVPFTYTLNNLNRSMGLPDLYPFVLSAPVIEKLRFVDSVISRSAGRPLQ